ncbi:hypothetical protein BGW39_011448 [Mortierella sp. 14UC]|nr:hypothetical protein BGW39_011448 [Mortierella sp. 14UC]
MPDIAAAHQAYNKVCQDLDDLVLEYISLVNEHLTVWTRISNRFQEGRELISQAKYIMGPKNVSADCYDHRMKALRGVMIKDPTTEIEIRDLRAEEIERQRLRKAQEEEDAAAGKDQGDHQRQRGETGYDDQDQQPSRAGLRRRGGGGGGGGGGVSLSEDLDGEVEEADRRHQSTTDASSSSSVTTIGSTPTGTTTTGTAGDATKKKERNPDPLLWFGVFVPAPLRSAQSVFQQGLQDVVEMAAIRQRLIELEGKMAALREAKAEGTKQLEADLTAMRL